MNSDNVTTIALLATVIVIIAAIGWFCGWAFGLLAAVISLVSAGSVLWSDEQGDKDSQARGEAAE